MLQDEERDPLLHSFSHLKEVLNNVTGESRFKKKKKMCLIYCKDEQIFSVKDCVINILDFVGPSSCQLLNSATVAQK